MYKITHFDKKLCRMLRKYFNIITDDCEIYSIWSFCPTLRWTSFQDFMFSSPLCRTDWFPVLYWLVLINCIFGAFYSAIEFTRLFWGKCKRVSVWRERKYYVLPYSILKKCRIAGAIFMANMWLLLIYSIISVSPAHMKPWLSINIVMLSFETAMWLLEVMTGSIRITLQSTITILLPLFNYYFVRCMHTVFQKAIEDNEVSELKLWFS